MDAAGLCAVAGMTPTVRMAAAATTAALWNRMLPPPWNTPVPVVFRHRIAMQHRPATRRCQIGIAHAGPTEQDAPGGRTMDALDHASGMRCRLAATREDEMLKGIDHRLNAEVLACLRAMGHGDMLIVSDTNFPADSVARATVTGQLLRMENLTAAQAIDAILSVLPLDTFVDDFAGRMEMTGQPDEIPPVQAEVQAEIDRAEGRPRPMIAIERFAFYDLARTSYAVIQTGRAALLGLLHVAQGRHPTGRLRPEPTLEPGRTVRVVCR